MGAGCGARRACMVTTMRGSTTKHAAHREWSPAQLLIFQLRCAGWHLLLWDAVQAVLSYVYSAICGCRAAAPATLEHMKGQVRDAV